MEYLLISFRSRASTVKISNLLTKSGISNEIINTPKEAQIGCGLSIKISKNAFKFAKQILSTTKEAQNALFFSVKTIAGKRFVKNI